MVSHLKDYRVITNETNWSKMAKKCGNISKMASPYRKKKIKSNQTFRDVLLPHDSKRLKFHI